MLTPGRREHGTRIFTASVVGGGAAQELVPGALLVGRGRAPDAVEAAFVEVDEPDLAGRADDEVAEIRVAEAHAQLDEALPEFVNLVPQMVANGGRLLGVLGDAGAQCA